LADGTGTEAGVVQRMREFVADMRRKIEQWKSELTNLEASDANEWVKAQIGEQLSAWIAEGKRIIADSGY
jgi:hypothetical protein